MPEGTVSTPRFACSGRFPPVSTTDEDRTPDAPLADGRYDVFVVDAHGDEADAGRVIAEVTLLEGEAKGFVLAVGCSSSELLDAGGDPIDLLGETGVLTVDRGAPHLRLDR